MIRKSVLDDIGNYDVTMQQVPDFDLVVRMVAHSPLYMIEEEMVFVRIRREAANNSAYSAAKELRNQYEQVALLETYANLSLELAQQVFKKHVKNLPMVQATVPYIASLAALEVQWECTRWFGIKTLGKLLKDETTRDSLHKMYGFTTKDFYKLLGEHKIFNSPHIDLSRLYVANDHSFTHKQQLVMPVRINAEKGSYRFCNIFLLPKELQGMNTFRWDPAEYSINSVVIIEISVQDQQGEWHKINVENISGREMKRIRNRYLFATLDPALVFSVESINVIAVKIDAIVEYAWEFMLKNYTSLLQHALIDNSETQHQLNDEHELILTQKETGNQITHMPMDMSFNFISRIAAKDEGWVRFELDSRIFEKNNAVVIEEIKISGRNKLNETKEIKFIVFADKDKKDRYFIQKHNSSILILINHDIVEIVLEGKIKRFYDWEKKQTLQPSEMLFHPLKNLELRYTYKGNEEFEIKSASIYNETANIWFVLHDNITQASFTPCTECMGALKIIKAYSIDSNGVANTILINNKKATSKWNLFAGFKPPCIELSVITDKRPVLVMINYDIMFGGTKAIIKKLLKKHPLAALSLLIEKINNKLSRKIGK